MKKIVVMVFLLGLAVVSVQAKTSDRTGDVIKKNVSRAIGDVYWQLHTQAVEKQGIDAKNQEWVNHIAKDVSDQLNRLNERKEYKGTLSAVIAAHNYLIQSAGQSGKEHRPLPGRCRHVLPAHRRFGRPAGLGVPAEGAIGRKQGGCGPGTPSTGRRGHRPAGAAEPFHRGPALPQRQPLHHAQRL